jgi:hypothetical protein
MRGATLRRAVGLGLCAWGIGTSVARAQQPSTENVTLAPIECWVRTSSNAVHVGEHFTMVLTCAVVETQSTTVVPDQSRLDPGALQAPPFEVVGGTQAPDLRTRTHRFFQYEYALRFVGEQVGTDVELPGPTITYRVQSRVQMDSAVEGRERQYVLPSRRLRIVSLVPATATDIADVQPDTFRAIEDRRFRANLLGILSWLLYGTGAMVVAWALAGLLRRPRADAAARRLRAPDHTVLRVAAHELERVRGLGQVEGWNGDLAAQALAPLRLAASYATGRPTAQVPANGTPPGAGQLRVSPFGPRRRSMLVSGSATAESIARHIERDTRAGRVVEEHLADLQAALSSCSVAAYGRDGTAAGPDIDAALERGIRGARLVARRHSLLARTSGAIRRATVHMRDRAWRR